MREKIIETAMGEVNNARSIMKWLVDGCKKLAAVRQLVGSAGVCGSIEEMMVYVEIIPREVTDIIRNPTKDISERCGSEDDSLGFETLYDAVVEAQHVGAGILGEVKPQNLLFVFGQTIQSLGYAPIELPPPPPFSEECACVDGDGYESERGGEYEKKPEHRAIILCKLKYADELEKFLVGKEKECGHDAKCYQITWSEFQELKKNLEGFGQHD